MSYKSHVEHLKKFKLDDTERQLVSPLKTEEVYTPTYCQHWIMEIFCLLLPPPLNHWALSTTVPFDSSHIAITLTTTMHLTTGIGSDISPLRDFYALLSYL